MSTYDPERDPVEQLADEFAERYRRGEFPSVTEYVEQNPEHAEELQELLPAVAMMEQLKNKEDSKLDSLVQGTPHALCGCALFFRSSSTTILVASSGEWPPALVKASMTACFICAGMPPAGPHR